MAAPRKPSPDRVIKAAMALAAERRWRAVTLTDIADGAGVSLSQLHAVFSSKGAILRAFSDKIDAVVLDGTDDEARDEPINDRLLDVLVRRLEALQDYKPAIRSILRDTLADPVAALCGGPRLLHSMAWSLEAAGVASSGVRGRLRTKGLAAIYLSTLYVWLRDDSPDLGRTLAHLDRALRRAERLAMTIGLAAKASPDSD
ncbi:MAG: TetR family transcriptional regulator [Rhodospirillales bacterium]|nr:TetR family transcriptional regulator [Rhodospirillales bacterium]